MTREEAIERLKQNKAAAKFYAGMVQNTNAIENELKDIEAMNMAIEALSSEAVHGWIPVNERLPSEEERKEWIDKNLDGIGHLYPCLVTRYSSINPDRTKNNPYVAKHYFDGEDFVNCGEEVCSEYVLAWMPLPEPYREDGEA